MDTSTLSVNLVCLQQFQSTLQNYQVIPYVKFNKKLKPCIDSAISAIQTAMSADLGINKLSLGSEFYGNFTKMATDLVRLCTFMLTLKLRSDIRNQFDLIYTTVTRLVSTSQTLITLKMSEKDVDFKPLSVTEVLPVFKFAVASSKSVAELVDGGVSGAKVVFEFRYLQLVRLLSKFADPVISDFSRKLFEKPKSLFSYAMAFKAIVEGDNGDTVDEVPIDYKYHLNGSQVSFSFKRALGLHRDWSMLAEVQVTPSTELRAINNAALEATIFNLLRLFEPFAIDCYKDKAFRLKEKNTGVIVSALKEKLLSGCIRPEDLATIKSLVGVNSLN